MEIFLSSDNELQAKLSIDYLAPGFRPNQRRICRHQAQIQSESMIGSSDLGIDTPLPSPHCRTQDWTILYSNSLWVRPI